MKFPDFSEFVASFSNADEIEAIVGTDERTFEPQPLIEDFETALAEFEVISSLPRQRGPKPRKAPDKLLRANKDKAHTKLLCTWDIETDPFKNERKPNGVLKSRTVKPFVWDFYDGKTHTTVWDEKRCIARFIEFLDSLSEPCLIYAHNGGKFDWLWCAEHLRDIKLVINGRIVQAFIGKHEIRDSYAAIPVGLGQYKKIDIEMRKLEPRVRAKHRQEIIKYLCGDTTYLHELISAYIREFGNCVTMAGAAMKQLKQFHSYDVVEPSTDKYYRTFFYFGGRVECFQSGIIHQVCKVYDVNSMYPGVMRNSTHPIGANLQQVTQRPRITDKTVFVVCTGKNFGAFPQRQENRGLKFNVPEGTFYTTVHEFRAAEETGLFKCTRLEEVHNVMSIADLVTFEEFIDHFYNARIEASERGDEILKLFYKLIMNSSYGKFAMDPGKFKLYDLRKYSDVHPGDEWELDTDYEDIRMKMWAKGSPRRYSAFLNITTAASITGAARAQLMRGIALCNDIVYCDTDSVICDSLTGVDIHPKKLGAWKYEKEGTWAAIAGKKLYAVFAPDKPEQGKEESKKKYNDRLKNLLHKPTNDWCHKFATKGNRITPSEIVRVAKGEKITWDSPSPTVHMGGRQTYISRDIRRTA